MNNNNNQSNNRVDNQIQNQQRTNELNQQSNISKGMSPYKNYKKTNYKSNIDSPDSNKRMKMQLNNNTKLSSKNISMGSNSINKGIDAAKNYKNANTVKEKENAKTQMKGSVANAAVTGLTGSKTIGNLAEKAVKMKDNLNPLKAMKNAVLGKINGDDEPENQYDELGNPKQQENRLENVSFTIPPKVIKWIVIAGIPAFSVIIFIVLFVTASQTYVNMLGIDSADKVKEEQLESKDDDDDWHEEGKGSTEIDDVQAFNYSDKNLLVDNFIDDNNILTSGNINENISLVARKHEAKLSDINDYFSDKLKCSGENCKKQPEYLFYLKMNDIYLLYSKVYKVKLDLPLLMSALSISDEQLPEVYKKNSKGYSLEMHDKVIEYIDNCKSGSCSEETLNIDPKYDYKNIDGYTYLATKDFTYDMQILAQNMVTQEGDSYKKDLEHFDEFLEEYIELKYYTNDSKKNELFDGDGETTSESNIVSTAFKKYDLTDEQIAKIASLCRNEQGSVIGVKAEASLVANRYELSGRTSTKGDDLMYFLQNVETFFAQSSVAALSKPTKNKKYIDAVKSVLVDGKRTLPGYVDEHDCIDCGNSGYDVIKIVTGNTITTTLNKKKLKSHSSYIPHKTVIYNRYTSVYTFYSFPTASSDPFGYTSTENRKKIGDFYYDNSGNPVGNAPGTQNPNVKGDYTKWKQCSPEWGDKLISTRSVCDVGCLVTSIAIQVARSGTQLTVKDFNPMTVVSNASFGCPSANALCNANFSKYAPNFSLDYTKDTSGMSRASIIKQLKEEIEKGNYPIIYVDGHHFVAVIGTTNDDIIMQDPGSSSETHVYKVYNSVGEIQVYKKND